MSKWMKKGDRVVVLAGNDKGRTGVVLRRMEDRVVVQGVNVRKKHAKKRSQAQKSAIIEMEAPIHISNVQFCNEDGQAVRVRSDRSDVGRKLICVRGETEEVFRMLRKVK